MLCITAISVILGLYAHAAKVFDLSKYFSFRNNPNGVWQYGYSETKSLDPDEFRVDQYADPTGPVGFWHPSVSGPGPGWYPYIAFNTTQQTQFDSQKGWAVRRGEVALEASNSGQYSLVRFKAPEAGAFKITARFEGIHFGLSTTDVHVLHGTSLFDAEITGYGGDPAVHSVQGTSPTACYSRKVQFRANDTVTFAVGYGENKTNYSDNRSIGSDRTACSREMTRDVS